MYAKEKFSFSSGLKVSAVKLGTICGGCNINLDGYEHDTNSKKKNILIDSTRQHNF